MIDPSTSPTSIAVPAAAETRTLKAVGLAGILAACGLLAYLSADIGDDLGAALIAKYAAGSRPFVTFVALGFVGINLAVAGALAAVTGTRRLSLAHPTTRKGFVVMWLGADALVLGLILGTMERGRNDVIVEWADLQVVVAYAAVALGMVLLRTGWKFDVQRAVEVVATDLRPPVVYLRSFQDDVRSPVRGPAGAFLRLASWFMPTSFEQELAVIMNQIGPFLAVGRPGERLPELGANRFYFANDEWQSRVAGLVGYARLTVILCGPTPNLWWEIDHVFASASPRRVVLIIPERGEPTRVVERQLEERLRCPGALQDHNVKRGFIPWLLGWNQTFAKVVCFPDAWTPEVYPLQQLRNVRMLSKILRRPFSVYAAPLQITFEQVFARIDLPWRPPGPNRMVAIVLAVILGWGGAHLFYLGDRRRGLRYLMFFWTMVPIVLSLRDAVRLVLMDRGQFEQNWGRRSREEDAAGM